MHIEDRDAEIAMNLNQIISLADLIMDKDETTSTNILTIRDLAEIGLRKILDK